MRDATPPQSVVPSTNTTVGRPTATPAGFRKPTLPCAVVTRYGRLSGRPRSTRRSSAADSRSNVLRKRGFRAQGDALVVDFVQSLF
jgi:hypothetical protein